MAGESPFASLYGQLPQSLGGQFTGRGAAMMQPDGTIKTDPAATLNGVPLNSVAPMGAPSSLAQLGQPQVQQPPAPTQLPVNYMQPQAAPMQQHAAPMMGGAMSLAQLGQPINNPNSRNWFS